MTNINRLSLVDELSRSDSLPLYARSNSDARRTSVGTLIDKANEGVVKAVDLAAENGAELVGTPTGNVQDDLDARPTTAALAASGGAALVGYDGGTSQDVLDGAKTMQHYTALRAYTGRATGVRITTVSVAGTFWRDDSDTTTADNSGTVIVDASGRRWKRIYEDLVNITWFGAKNDGSDAFPDIEKALDLVASMDAGKILIPFTTETAPFCISDTIKLWNNTTLICDGWLKIIGDTEFDAAVSGVAGAVNWSVYGLKVDANSVPAQGGLYLRRNNTGVFVDSVLVKNAVHDTTTKGGRAFTSEAGVNPALYGSRKSYVGSVIAIDCYCAASIQGGDTNAAPNLVIGSIIGENCQNLLMAFGNSAGYPFAGTGMQAVIGKISGYNCGASTSYLRRQGIINSDRGSNISIGQISVVNTDAYVDAATYPPYSLFLGDFNGWQVGQSLVDSKGLASAIHFSRFDEANSIGSDIFESYDNDFDVTLRQACVNALTSSLSADTKVQRTRVRLTVKEAFTGATILASQMQAKTTTWLDLMYWPQNARISGFCSRIDGSTPTQYATVDASLVSDRRFAVAYNPPSLAVGAASTLQTTAATGARVGEIVKAVFSLDPQGVEFRAWVSAAGTISWYAYNPAANPVGTVDLAAGTVRFYVQPVL